MIQEIYVIYDKIAEDCGPIMNIKNEGVALRAFRYSVAQADGADSEFGLYKLGTIDSSTMEVKLEKTPVQVHVPQVVQGVKDA